MRNPAPTPPPSSPTTHPHSARPSQWRRRLRQPAFWVGAWATWFLLLCIFSSIPGHRLGRLPFDWFDKLEHAGFFFLGTSLMGAWLLATGRWPAKWWLLPALAAVVGLFDEAHQLMTPGRSGMDAGDWLADVIGGTLALIPVAVVARWRRQRS